MAKRKKNLLSLPVEEFDDYEVLDEDGFREGDIENGDDIVVSFFNFTSENSNAEQQLHLADTAGLHEDKCSVETTTLPKTELEKQPAEMKTGEPESGRQILFGAAGEVQREIKENETVELIDNRKLQTQAYGITPPVDGEHFEINRTFKFRKSTVRMLNRLKAEHTDENVYLSSIVDEALRFYYKHVFEGDRSSEKARLT